MGSIFGVPQFSSLSARNARYYIRSNRNQRQTLCGRKFKQQHSRWATGNKAKCSKCRRVFAWRWEFYLSWWREKYECFHRDDILRRILQSPAYGCGSDAEPCSHHANDGQPRISRTKWTPVFVFGTEGRATYSRR